MAAVNAYDKITYGEFKLPSLQELMVAPMYMQQLHNKAEEEFLQNQALAADAATRFQPGIDDAAIQANQQFQSSVQADINDLAKNGLTPGIRRRLIQRKTDFTNNILPLNKAAVDREQWAKAAKEAQLRNPSLIIKDPMQVGLDRWIADPTSHELHPISGQEIYERTRQAMIPISKYISQNLPQLARTGLPFQYFTIAQSGATAEEIATLMGSQYKDIDPRLLSPLANLIKDAADSVVTSTGVYDYYGADSNEARRVNEYAASAFSHALGTKSFGNMSDKYNMELALLRARPGKGDKDPSGYPHLNVRTNIKIQGKIDKTQKLLNKVRALQDKNSKVWDTLYEEYLNNAEKVAGFFQDQNMTSSTNVRATNMSKDEFIDNYTKGISKEINRLLSEARDLGVTNPAKNLQELEGQLSDLKRTQAIGSKEYVFNPTTDQTLIETLNNQLASQWNSKTLISDTKPSELLNENGTLKNGLQYAVNKKGLVVIKTGKKDKNTEEYVINTSRLSDRLNQMIERAKKAYDQNYFSDISLTPDQIKYLREVNPEAYYGLTDDEINDQYLDEYQAQMLRNAVVGGYDLSSVKNKPINVEP